MAVCHAALVLVLAGVCARAKSRESPAAWEMAAVLQSDDQEAVGLLQLRASALGSGAVLSVSGAETVRPSEVRPSALSVDLRGRSDGDRFVPAFAWPAPRNCSVCWDPRDPLMAFFEAAGGLGWDEAFGWGSSQNPCQWFGVMCNPAQALVGLDLGQNNLQGTLTKVLETLRPLYPSLNILGLGANDFHGKIPDKIQDMQTLTYLGLMKTGLTGTIPAVLGNLPRLRQIAIGDNKLEGTIPEELGDLEELEVLELFGQPLNGPIPESFGKLSQLSELSLIDTELGGTIPSSLGRLTNLMYLQLSNATLEGPIPDSFSHLSNMLQIGLHENDLTGTIPEGLGKWTGLTSLMLKNNRLEGTVPKSLGRMTKLGSADFSENKLTCFPPELFSQWPEINSLSLGSNSFSAGTLPESLGDLKELAVLNITDGNFSGSIPTTLGSLRNLQKLILAGNSLEGEIPDLGNLFAATVVDLSGNALNGTMPRLPDTGMLWKLNISGNKLQRWNAGDVCESVPRDCDISGNDLSCPVHEAGCAMRCGVKCPVVSTYINHVKVVLDVLWYPFGLIFGLADGRFVERPVA